MRSLPLLPLALAASLALIGLELGGAFLWPGRLWGANALAFAGTGTTAALLALAAVLLVPPVARGFGKAASRTWLFLCGEERLAPRRLVAMGTAAFLLFALLRSANYFLGDGYLRLRELARGYIWLRSADFLDLALHYRAWQFLRGLGAEDPATGYWVVSALAGALWVMLLPALSRQLVAERELRWTVPAFLLTLGTVQLFFGYVECYTLRELGIAAYFLFALRALAGGSPLPATGVLALTSAFHLSALALAPSLLPLYVRESARPAVSVGRTARGLAWTVLGLAAAAAAAFVARRQYGSLEALLPFHGGSARAYAFLSRAHLTDVANFLLLAAPAAALLAAVGALVRGERPSPPAEEAPAEPAAAAAAAETAGPLATSLFWSLAVAGPLCFLVSVDPRLGPRDWDLMALPAAPLAFAGLALLFGRRSVRRHGPAALGTAAAILWGASLVHAVPWVLTNHSFERSARMVRVMVENDPHHLWGECPPLAPLAEEYDRQGLPDDALLLLRRALAARPDNYCVHAYRGRALMRRGELGEAEIALTRAAELKAAQERWRKARGGP